MPELNISPEGSNPTHGTPAPMDDTAAGPGPAADAAADSPAAAKAPAKKRATRKTTAKKTASKRTASSRSDAGATAAALAADSTAPAGAADTIAPAEAADTTAPAADATGASATKAAPRRRTRKAATPAASEQPSTEQLPSKRSGTADTGASEPAASDDDTATKPRQRSRRAATKPAVLFQAPDFEAAPLFVPPEAAPARSDTAPRRSRTTADTAGDAGPVDVPAATAPRRARTTVSDAGPVDDAADIDPIDDGTTHDTDASSDDSDESGPRRRRRRGGRGRRKKGEEAGSVDASDDDTTSEESGAPDAVDESEADDADADQSDGESSSSRRRRRRRRRKGDEPDDTDDTTGTTRVRDGREVEDEVTSLKGSTRLEAKKQRRREGREAGRRRPPILSEAEFLARRESVDRVMAVRQSGDLTQIAVLEDDVLVEHYVSQAAQQSLIGNVYLGRVQNVLPAMEAAFVDIGRGRNAVIYAGEVDWSGRKNDGPRRIEDVLKSGQSILVQVTKDPIGHKGARLTSQVSLPGRYVVYVPGGSMSGISRKLPDTERTRLKNILKKVVPDDAGVIVRTAAEGASEEELTADVTRLQKQWDAIRAKSDGQGPVLLHGEPDLAIKVVRDLFNEDFNRLIVSGDDAWNHIEDYVTHVASSLADRVQKWTGRGDLFADKRIDEQIAKALDRKVWLPSGGSLVIDRTEAMTVVDVNTGKFTGSGGNLEETVTKNNLEAAEEIVRQLRLRDIGGIIVVDFIDMVLEANRDLVLRRLVECLGRDRTKHQVAEVTSLGLVQMTRKRIGTGLLEAFSEQCQHCKGRGLVMHLHPVESGSKNGSDDTESSGSRRSARGRRRRDDDAVKAPEPPPGPKLDASAVPSHASPADLFAGGAANGTNGSEQLVSDPETAVDADAADEAAAASSGRRGRRRAQRSEGRPDTGPDETTSVTSTAESVTPESARSEPTTPETAPAAEAPSSSTAPSILTEALATPARRGRRRAERPAGRPELATSGDSATPTTVDPPAPVVISSASTGDSTGAGVSDAPAGIPVTTVGTAVVETVTRRPRRRVERPAGKPDEHATTENGTSAGDGADAPSEPATTTT